MSASEFSILFLVSIATYMYVLKLVDAANSSSVCRCVTKAFYNTYHVLLLTSESRCKNCATKNMNFLFCCRGREKKGEITRERRIKIWKGRRYAAYFRGVVMRVIYSAAGHYMLARSAPRQYRKAACIDLV